ncbi:arylamine N-acetyltransferase [Nocardioides sp.]|uniref:arylamine N-acetyltransferase family protein n=1 Tax=Nocardioides sp. TaxID=35761 RepID=UPI00286C6C66|nr:arylamine N-acetyltransferase [Nocardioides sp.]
MSIRAYLAHLGIEEPLPPTLESLRLVHRRHVEQIPYENLQIMLGRPPSVDPESSLTRVGEVGRAGYCFHQNAVLELVLRDLGFAVERRHGHVWINPEKRADPFLNHLVLVVTGLPTDDNPDGRWWPDVGLGEGFLEPLPLVAGDYVDGPLRFEVTEVTEDGWSFRNDPTGTFTGLEVTSAPTDPMTVLDSHATLSTAPDGVFSRILVVQRRDPLGVDTLRGCVRGRVDGEGRRTTDLTSYDEWRGALVGLGLSLVGVQEAHLRALFDRTLVGHEQWVAAGRP